MRYLVTGATGFLGGRIAARLRSRGDEVVALVRPSAQVERLRDLGVALHRGDVTDRASVERAVRGIDRVFHVAAWYVIGRPDVGAAESVNVGGTRNVLECALQAGVSRIVYTSTLAVYSDTHGRRVDETYRFNGHHLTLYDRTKAAAHYEVAEPLLRSGAPLIVLLPGVLYGPGDRSAIGQAITKYLHRRLRVIPSRTTYCWGHVDDIAAVHLDAMDRGTLGEKYIVAGPAHRIDEVFALARQITGIPAPWLVPASLLRVAALFMRPISALAPVRPGLHPENLRVLGGVSYLGDDGKARDQLGFRPRPLVEGLRDTLGLASAQLGT